MTGVRRLTWQVLVDRRAALTRLAGWSVAESLPALLSGYLTARAVDDGFLAGRFGTGLAWLAGLAVAIAVGAWGTGRVYRSLGAVVEPFRDDLTTRLVRSTLVGAGYPGSRSDSTAVARLTHQVEVVRDTFGGLLMVVRGFLFAAGAALLGLLALAPVVAALVAGPLLAGLVVFGTALPAMVRHQRDLVVAGEEFARSAGAALAAHRDVVAARAGERIVGQVGRRVAAQATAERTVSRMAALRSLSLGVGGWSPVAVLLLAAPWLVRQGVTAGAVLGALIYVSTGLRPALHALVHGVGGGGLRYVVTLDRLLGAAQVTPPPARTPQVAPPAVAPQVAPPAVAAPAGQPVGGGPGTGTVGRPAVRLRGLTFRYGNRARAVLDRFDLDLAEGDHLAVVGPSGAGKSTLAALMAGLLQPEQGTVRLTGVPTAGASPTVLARLRVLVPQEAYVFTASLADNLRYLHPEADERTLLAALDVVGGGPLAARLGGLSARITPGGLSAGERQVIAATRAYLSPARLVLLDEATCHLDPATEAQVERAFADRPGALVVVAHRISSALRARRVLVFDGDRPVTGTHDELLTRSATYRELAGYWDRDIPVPERHRPAPATPLP
ncbi:ATP-binding cassette domain-containing protein [Micromonospora echinofusca]|uniref:ATP-binding cassette domain-containing protein n=1 Tax=Micromonospora echinofusca TaxID=47858 RepID=A0ABS3VXQ6_MICEH|nr:ABC transporter ATP-binding protein [Micromonospora echinofusca]MBO4209288.1 ATP-binding cassette domain-containing protein [Micromonospora echinofusca]